ncbi:MAG: protein kinase [Lachnospiraceae bacterium]|nr:protein kinase [Lachnospiraceae bacterium]
MDVSLISQCRTVAAISPDHQVYLVQHPDSRKLYVMKIMDVYNAQIYRALMASPVTGTPKIAECREENGRLTVIEEYISGTALSEMIENHSLTESRIFSIMEDLCGIVQKLHAMNQPLIHRDIKPSNILIVPYGHAVLLDFNAAKFYSQTSAADTVLLGTKGYAAPEQYGFGSSSPQTDIYALGVCLREMVQSLPVPTHRFDRMIETCTQIDPKKRYTDADRLANALKSAEGVSSPVNGSPSRRDVSASFLPPGFRTRTPWKMGLSAAAYSFILYETFVMKFLKDLTPAQRALERLSFLACCLSLVLITFNYRNIQKTFPLCRSSSRVLRILGVVILNAISLFVILLLMVIIEPLLS